jgi:hypothetical protein
MDQGASGALNDARKTVLQLLAGPSKKARFVTELRALTQAANVDPQELERALIQLEAEGLVIIRDHFCADPHLAAVDLRIAALVAANAGADPQMSAIREIDRAWDKWLADYLANHRCS